MRGTVRVVFATGLTDHLPDVPGLAERWGRDIGGQRRNGELALEDAERALAARACDRAGSTAR